MRSDSDWYQWSENLVKFCVIIVTGNVVASARSGLLLTAPGPSTCIRIVKRNRVIADSLFHHPITPPPRRRAAGAPVGRLWGQPRRAPGDVPTRTDPDAGDGGAGDADAAADRHADASPNPDARADQPADRDDPAHTVAYAHPIADARAHAHANAAAAAAAQPPARRPDDDGETIHQANRDGETIHQANRDGETIHQANRDGETLM
jgi:hypothetical protein